MDSPVLTWTPEIVRLFRCLNLSIDYFHGKENDMLMTELKVDLDKKIYTSKKFKNIYLRGILYEVVCRDVGCEFPDF